MLKSKKFNIILALIVAIVLWAYVLGEINPTSSTVIRNVPINFTNQEALEAEGLTVLSTSAETVNGCPVTSGSSAVEANHSAASLTL